MKNNEIQKNLKKVLKETKEKKDRILIEQKLVETRIMNIFGTEDNIRNFHLLPENTKLKIAWAVMEEIRFLDENEILNEQLGDFLGKLFGGAPGSFVETLVEPLVNSILSGLGIEGFFKNFLTSFLTSNPRELARALRDCRALTTLVSNSLAEALAMKLSEKANLTGGFYTFLRNALGKAVKDTAFVNKIEDFLGDMICKTYDKLANNAGNVLQKLQSPAAVVAAK
jgi:hypothetical protein